MATDTANSAEEDFNSSNRLLECVEEESGHSEISTDSFSNEGSQISLAQKIILESNDKRLRERMDSLKKSITSLKEQFRTEKNMWREDLEKIRILQQHQEQQQMQICHCGHQSQSKNALRCLSASGSSVNSLCLENTKSSKTGVDSILKINTIKQLLEYQNYRRKLAETENMCSLELNKVKQSLDDLKTLQCIAEKWGNSEDNYTSVGDYKSIKDNNSCHKNNSFNSIHEIFVKQAIQ